MSIKRRNFIKGLSLSPIALSVTGYKKAVADFVSYSPEKAFGFSNNKVPMNAANLCPMPISISKTIADFNENLDIDMSGMNRSRIGSMKEEARAGLAKQLHVKIEEIAITRNTSESNNIIAQGLSLKPDDEILLWDQNHPSNDVSWAVRADRSKCKVNYFDIPLSSDNYDNIINIIENQITKKTRVVSFTHISNITGFKLPAAEICQSIKEKYNGIHIHVDGAQTWGVEDVDLAAMKCDSFSGSSHKWYMGPRETGLLFVKESAVENIWPSIVSIGWGSKRKTSAAGAKKFEAYGQRHDAALASLAETVKFHNEITPKKIQNYAYKISEYIRESLIDIDIDFVSSNHHDFRSNVIILKAAQENRKKILENILNDAGVILAGTGGLRLSPHIYNTIDHADRVVRAINKSRKLLS